MNDPLGQAIADYYYKNAPAKLWIHNTYGPKEEMPVSAYFRDYAAMPAMEHAALQLCEGSILDIGAGAGSHALWLQQQGAPVTALELSELSCGVMKKRGLRNVVQQDIFTFGGAAFDSLLLQMNGIGLTATLGGLRLFLQQAEKLLRPGGKIILDSSDVAYLYEYNLPDIEHYYGEIAYRYEYKRKKSEWFNWLYIDRHTLSSIATAEGWQTTFVNEDENGQYLVTLHKI